MCLPHHRQLDPSQLDSKVCDQGTLQPSHAVSDGEKLHFLHTTHIHILISSPDFIRSCVHKSRAGRQVGEGQRLRWKSGQPMLGSEKPHSMCPDSSHPHPHLGSQLCQESSPCAAHQHGVAAMATGMQGQAHPSIVNSPASKPGLDRAAQVSKKVGGPWLQGSSPYLVCAHGCLQGGALAALLQT